MIETNLRAALYARISKADANVPKVANQLATLRKLAATRGYEVVGEYADDGVSASTGEARPEFERLSSDLAGGRFNVILATEEARLARTELEKAGLMFACATVGATWETARDGAVDPATASGALMATIRGGVDAFESRRKSERQLSGERDRRAAGKPRMAGPRPFGYNEDRTTIRKDEAALIRRGLDMILAGGARWDVVKLFNASGLATTVTKLHCPTEACAEKDDNGKHVSVKDRANCPDSDQHERVPNYAWIPTTVYDTLTRARNANLIEHEQIEQGKRSPDGKRPLRKAPAIVGSGTWEPICSGDELMRVRAILATPVRETAGKPPETFLSGIAKCYCGAIMHAHGMSWARVYRCSTMNTQWSRKPAPARPDGSPGKHVAITIELLDAHVRDAVLDAYFDTPVGTGAAKAEAKDIADLHNAIASVREGIEALMEMRLTGLPQASWAKKNAELVRQEEELTTRLESLGRESAHASMLQASLAALWAGVADLPRREGNIYRPGRALIDSFVAEGMTREDAINAATRAYWRDNPERESVRTGLGERFDALPLAARRSLVRAVCKVVVAPGRGVGRVAVDAA